MGVVALRVVVGDDGGGVAGGGGGGGVPGGRQPAGLELSVRPLAGWWLAARVRTDNLQQLPLVVGRSCRSEPIHSTIPLSPGSE